MTDSTHPAELAPPRFSVVVPFFDEAGNAAPLIAEIVDAMREMDAYEIVAVDDCSTDGTAAELDAAASGTPALRILRHARNLGQSAALCTGVASARGHWIVTLDGDGQNDPADIPALVRHLDTPVPHAPDVAAAGRGPDLVCGHRHARRDNGLRRLSSRLANAVRGRLLDDDTPDTGCGLKVFPRELFLRLPRFDHMHRFLPALVRREGGVTLSVPVGHRPRVHGRSSYGVWNRLWIGIVDLLGVMWLRRRALRTPLPETTEPGNDVHER